MTTPIATLASPLHKALSDSLPQGGEVELRRTGPDHAAARALGWDGRQQGHGLNRRRLELPRHNGAMQTLTRARRLLE